MRLDKWFISNLDDSQRQIIVRDPNENLIVQGAAGSGKTNLAIHRAVQASAYSNSYALVVYTQALKRMVAYGMDALGLDKERIAYDWAWENRGFDLVGDVYCLKVDNLSVSSKKVFIAQNGTLREFEKVGNSYENAKSLYPNDTLVSLDFGDWVASKFYYAFGRRSTWFHEISLEPGINVANDNMVLIPSGTLFRKAEDKIDYLIVDEAQDFDVNDYLNRFLPKVNKSLSLFGDSAQKIYINRGASMDQITAALRYRRLFLKYNYRLPKSIAKMAQDIPVPPVDLMSDNMKDGGNSDYPQYPKPVVQKYDSREKELEGFINRIKMEDLDDVALLVKDEKDVKFVHEFFSAHGIPTQVLYRTGTTPPYNTINTLDFTNNDLPCILTYYAAKGTEFDNVFVPFANEGECGDRNAFYVACTRASHSLYITFSGKHITSYLNNVKPSSIVEKDIPSDAWTTKRPDK